MVRPPQRVRNQKRAAPIIDSDDECWNEPDLSKDKKENQNIIGNMMKTMGATVVDKKQMEQKLQLNPLPVGKGKKKVKKTRTYLDTDGYEVTEDYSSYEEYDLPPIKESIIIKPRNVVNRT